MSISRRTVVASAGIAALAPAILKAQTPVASPVAASGITWPEAQALPTFKAARNLLAIDLSAVSDSEKVLFATLQGIVNRTEPRIYIMQDRDEGPTAWLEDGLNVAHEVVDDHWTLLETFRDEIAGIVVTDPDITHTVNVATTIAGLAGGIVAAPAHIETLRAAPYDLEILDDLRGRFATNLEANQWQIDTLWPQVNQRMLIGIDPEGVFADLRDYAIANSTMPFWLDVNIEEERALFVQLLERVEPYTPYLGWFSQDVAGEFSGTQLCSEHSVFVLAADWMGNLTVWSGTAPLVEKARTAEPPPLENKVYVTFVVTEGDNLQYNQHRLRVMWDDPARGSVPISWTTQPLLKDCAPAMLAWYIATATENDHFMVGPSGAGYINPGPWPDETFDLFAQRTGEYMQATGMTTIYVLNRVEGEGVDLSDAEVQAFIDHADPRGLMLNWEGFTESKLLSGGLPQTVVHEGGDVDEITGTIATLVETWDGEGPLFLGIGILAWNLMPADIATIADAFDDRFVVLRGDQYFDLLRQAGSTATPEASPVS
jgi:hypothetical protein